MTKLTAIEMLAWADGLEEARDMMRDELDPDDRDVVELDAKIYARAEALRRRAKKALTELKRRG